MIIESKVGGVSPVTPFAAVVSLTNVNVAFQSGDFKLSTLCVLVGKSPLVQLDGASFV